MEAAIRVAAIGVIGSILAALLQRYGKEQSLVTAAAVTVGILLAAIAMLKPIGSVLSQLEQTTGVDAALLTPLYKCLAISLVCHFSASLCRDAGQSAVGESIQLMGTAAALYAALPLLLAVLSLIRRLLEA